MALRRYVIRFVHRGVPLEEYITAISSNFLGVFKQDVILNLNESSLLVVKVAFKKTVLLIAKVCNSCETFCLCICW